MTNILSDLKRTITNAGYKISKVHIFGEDDFIIDFLEPGLIDYLKKEKLDEEDMALHYYSSISYNKKQNRLSASFRVGQSLYNDLSYLHVCCKPSESGCDFLCRPHIENMAGTINIEAEFKPDDIDKVKYLIKEIPLATSAP